MIKIQAYEYKIENTSYPQKGKQCSKEIRKGIENIQVEIFSVNVMLQIISQENLFVAGKLKKSKFKHNKGKTK